MRQHWQCRQLQLSGDSHQNGILILLPKFTSKIRMSPTARPQKPEFPPWPMLRRMATNAYTNISLPRRASVRTSCEGLSQGPCLRVIPMQHRIGTSGRRMGQQSSRVIFAAGRTPGDSTVQSSLIWECRPSVSPWRLHIQRSPRFRETRDVTTMSRSGR